MTKWKVLAQSLGYLVVRRSDKLSVPCKLFCLRGNPRILLPTAVCDPFPPKVHPIQLSPGSQPGLLSTYRHSDDEMHFPLPLPTVLTSDPQGEAWLNVCVGHGGPRPQWTLPNLGFRSLHHSGTGTGTGGGIGMGRTEWPPTSLILIHNQDGREGGQ